MWRIISAFVILAIRSPFQASVLRVEVSGVVHPITVQTVKRALEHGAKDRCELVIFELNTPGGLMDSMRESMQAILGSRVPVVVFVTPAGARAASAGFFLLQAGDFAAMSPGTNTGAAHPVAAFGGTMDAVMRQKVENDAAALLRTVVEKRGRNTSLAETAVRESRSFTEREALDQHLIDIIASDDRDLLRQIEGRTVVRFDGSRQTLHVAQAQIVPYAGTWREKILNAVSDPNIAFVLLMIGALCIYIEFNTPGMVLPGVAGAILMLLGLSALAILPINWVGAALILAAFAMFALEAKITSHGVLGAGGAVALALGAVMLIDSPIPEMRIRPATALAVTLPFSAITIFLVTIVMRARRNKAVTGAEGMVGSQGVAFTDLAPSGKVFVHGEYWNAECRGRAAAGEQVRVIGIEGLTLAVEPAGKGESHE